MDDDESSTARAIWDLALDGALAIAACVGYTAALAVVWVASRVSRRHGPDTTQEN